MFTVVNRPEYPRMIDAVQHISPSWRPVFDYAMPELLHVQKVLDNCVYYPKNKDIFTCFDLCPLENVKVVILGQDPYTGLDPSTGEPQACGVSFATRRGCKTQPSVTNILNEIKREYTEKGLEYPIPDHGDLRDWCEQGVLLLNTALTVVPQKEGSHLGIWQGFTEKIIRKINEQNPTCIYLLWGAPAQKKMSSLSETSIKLVASHPSPRSFKSTKEPFYGCGHFMKVNEILESSGREKIDWILKS